MDTIDDTRLREGAQMAIVDPHRLEVVRLGMQRYVPRSKIAPIFGWVLFACVACAGGYAAGRKADDSGKRLGVISAELQQCQRGLQKCDERLVLCRGATDSLNSNGGPP